MSISNYAEAKILDACFNNVTFAVATPFVSLHTADPGETGGSEVTGGSYARQAGSWAAASAGSIASDTTLNFTGMPVTTITHVGVYDAVSAGNLIWSGALTASKTTASGDTFQIASGSITITLD